MTAPEPLCDYREVALQVGRAEFARLHPWFFLVGLDPVQRPRGRASTDVFEILESPGARTGTAVPRVVEDAPALARRGPEEELTPVVMIPESVSPTATAMMLAVRKREPNEGSRITVGRVSTSDIVIADADVSRAHAVFTLRSDHILLADLGSANGTMINGRLLEANGPAQMVVPGDRIRFALLEFELLDVGSAWDRVHQLGG